MNTTVVDKPFAWSYSQLKNYETCARRYLHYNVLKDVTEPMTGQLIAGNDLHRHFDARLKLGTPLPLGYGQYEKLLAKVVNSPGETVAEQKLAFTHEFEPSTYFAKDVWFRTVIDAGKIRDTTAIVFDWKTGKPNEDLTQLQLMAATLFVHMPNLERVKSALVFVNHDESIPAEFVRSDQGEIWNEILPRVKAVRRARESNEYPPKPSGLCAKYCAVKSCEFNGRGSR